MAMDIRLILHLSVLGSTLLSALCSIDVYMCSWPTGEVVQLRCDFENCPYLSVDQITVGRLMGNPASCTENNAEVSLRKPIASCNYQLMQTHDFFGQVKNNCSRKQVCEVSTEEMFQSAGICGREVGELDSIRNWIHIKHSCYGDIPGETCNPITTTTTTTTTTPATTTTEQTTTVRSTSPAATKVRRLMTRQPRTDIVTNRPADFSNGITLIIPILATLLFCTILLIVATMLYRHGICNKKHWKHTVQQHRHNVVVSKTHNSNGKAQIKLDDLHFKIDSSKLKELEKRLSKHQAETNDYCQDFSFPVTSLKRAQQKEASEEAKMRTASRRGRRNSAELPPLTNTISQTEQYFSDTSESTTITEGDIDRRKRRRVKPLPPLPKPVVNHSEVYFTETENESEAPKPRRKEPLPRLDPPPKVHRGDKPKYDRVRTSRPHSVTYDSNNRLSLELALTKGAAKKLNSSMDGKSRSQAVTSRKPVARPRNPRCATSLYGNIAMDGNMISPSNATAAVSSLQRRLQSTNISQHKDN